MTLKNTAITKDWFPDYQVCANSLLLEDKTYDDFDAQAERLINYDQSYIQITPGAFVGRFLTSFLGPDVAVHIEHCNQSLEQQIVGSNTDYSFGIVLGKNDVFRVNGHQLTQCEILVLPPGSSMHVHSPPEGAVLAIVINRDRLLSEPGLNPAVIDWLESLHGEVGVLRVPSFAARLREDVKLALEGMSVKGVELNVHGKIVGNALIASMFAKLSLEFASRQQTGPNLSSKSFNRFLEGRTQIHDKWDAIGKVSDLTSTSANSTRSIQKAFSTQLSVGPLAYLRILRLHMARRALLCSDQTNQSIGDVAANFGFWNWSRFSQLYTRQFGELPSHTKIRLRSQ